MSQEEGVFCRAAGWGRVGGSERRDVGEGEAGGARLEGLKVRAESLAGDR